MANIKYDDLEEFIDWIKSKSKLKFNALPTTFPIMPNCVYWAYMGCNIGSEEGKHRPVLVTRTYKNSTICTVIPLTTQRLSDGYWYHIDIENSNSTALCEQMRTIDIARIEKPYRVKGGIMSISQNDWMKIDAQVKWLYNLKDKPKV